MLIAIRTELERAIGKALPDWKRFSARVQRISEGDLPCVNMFFQSDRLIEEGNGLERREVMAQIEAGFIVKGDAEEELDAVRSQIEDAIGSSSVLALKVLKLVFPNVEFAHDMTGGQRVAVLMMSARIDYDRATASRKSQAINPGLVPTINGEKTDG
ncbi:MAG: hypothetical protein M3Q07_16920 [Pseudobdellovibrionaceae bacterium]|nr:hypothetical protein [Pseudobdellovibrionaceae bacterium]